MKLRCLINAAVLTNGAKPGAKLACFDNCSINVICIIQLVACS